MALKHTVIAYDDADEAALQAAVAGVPNTTWMGYGAVDQYGNLASDTYVIMYTPDGSTTNYGIVEFGGYNYYSNGILDNNYYYLPWGAVYADGYAYQGTNLMSDSGENLSDGIFQQGTIYLTGILDSNSTYWTDGILDSSGNHYSSGLLENGFLRSYGIYDGLTDTIYDTGILDSGTTYWTDGILVQDNFGNYNASSWDYSNIFGVYEFDPTVQFNYASYYGYGAVDSSGDIVTDEYVIMHTPSGSTTNYGIVANGGFNYYSNGMLDNNFDYYSFGALDGSGNLILDTYFIYDSFSGAYTGSGVMSAGSYNPWGILDSNNAYWTDGILVQDNFGNYNASSWDYSTIAGIYEFDPSVEYSYASYYGPGIVDETGTYRDKGIWDSSSYWENGILYGYTAWDYGVLDAVGNVNNYGILDSGGTTYYWGVLDQYGSGANYGVIDTFGDSRSAVVFDGITFNDLGMLDISYNYLPWGALYADGSANQGASLMSGIGENLSGGIFDAGTIYDFGIWDFGTYQPNGIYQSTGDFFGHRPHGVMDSFGNSEASGIIDAAGGFSAWGILDSIGDGFDYGILLTDGSYTSSGIFDGALLYGQGVMDQFGAVEAYGLLTNGGDYYGDGVLANLGVDYFTLAATDSPPYLSGYAAAPQSDILGAGLL